VYIYIYIYMYVYVYIYTCLYIMIFVYKLAQMLHLDEQVLFSTPNYRGTSLIRNCTTLLGPDSRIIPRVLWWSYGLGLFFVSEVPLCRHSTSRTGPQPNPRSFHL